MNPFKRNQEALTQENADLTAEVEKLTLELAEAKEQVIDPSEELATLTSENASLKEQLTDSQEHATKLEAKVDEVEANAAEKIADFDKKVSMAVAEEVTSIGLDEALDDEGGTNKTVFEQFQELTGSAQTAFYQENREEIKLHAGLK